MTEKTFNEILKNALMDDANKQDICKSEGLVIATRCVLNAPENEVLKYIKELRQTLIKYFMQEQEISYYTAMNFFIENANKTLKQKAEEYAAPNLTNPDRLHNFKQAEKLFGILPYTFCINLMLKHIISIIDIIEGVVDPDLRLINEKFGDAYNYCILLEAIVREYQNIKDMINE